MFILSLLLSTGLLDTCSVHVQKGEQKTLENASKLCCCCYFCFVLFCFFAVLHHVMCILDSGSENVDYLEKGVFLFVCFLFCFVFKSGKFRGQS